jgi:hypothetical protein
MTTMRRGSVVLLGIVAILLLSWKPTIVQAQGRFLRQGFNEAEDFTAELRLDEDDNGAGAGIIPTGSGGNAATTSMSREMYLLKDRPILLPALHDLSAISDNGALRRHVHQYLGQGPVRLKLLSKRGRYGYKAIGTLPDSSNNNISGGGSSNGLAFLRRLTQQRKKQQQTKRLLRAFWREPTKMTATTAAQQQQIKGRTDYTTASYDDAVRARLSVMEFHVQLPPLKQQPPPKGSSGSSNIGSSSSAELPTVVYQVPFDNGTIDPKSMVPRTVGRVIVRHRDREYVVDESCHIGTGGGGSEEVLSTATSTTRLLGVVDPSWARGRAVFRPHCRKSGL